MIAERWTEKEDLKQGIIIPFFKNSEVHRFLLCPKSSRRAFWVGKSPDSPTFFVSIALPQGRKDTEMPRKKEQRFIDNRPVRKSEYSADRESYMDGQGNYVYRQWQQTSSGKWELVPVCTIPVGENGENAEWTILLDDMDCEEDRRNDAIRRNTDTGFQAAQSIHESADSYTTRSEGTDPWEAEAYRRQRGKSLLDELLPTEETEDPLMTALLAAMDKLTDRQRDMIYQHLGMGMYLEDIRREEETAMGKKVSQQAVSARWDKIITRLCKELGVPKPRKRKVKYPAE